MNSLGDNRYQLLFIDDEAGEQCMDQQKLLEATVGNVKNKRKKMPFDKTKSTIMLSKKFAQLNVGKKVVGSKPEGITVSSVPLLREQQQSRQLQQSQQQQQKQTQKRLLPQQLQHNQQGQQTQKQLPQQQQLPQKQQQLQQQQQQVPPQQQFKERYFGAQGPISGLIINNSNSKSFGIANKLFKTKYDRHSNSDKTGIKAVVKRNGGGAHNWGSAIKDIEDENMAMKTAAVVDKDEILKEQQQQAESLIEDNIKYITVEEWRLKREERAKPIYNIRKAGEGELSKPEWKQMVVLQKKKLSKLDSETGLEYDASMYPQRVGRMQRVMDIEFKFKDDRRRSFYGGWQVRPRYDSEVDTASDPVNVADELEFPTLG